MVLIRQIVTRAKILLEECDPLKLTMDIEVCHCNGCQLDLAGLFAANDSDFRHDITGIRAHLNRQNGQLEDCFTPRFAKSNQ